MKKVWSISKGDFIGINNVDSSTLSSLLSLSSKDSNSEKTNSQYDSSLSSYEFKKIKDMKIDITNTVCKPSIALKRGEK